jgi:CRISPR/Cas system-associated exonuclease Cas4 (RecB family)
MTRGELSDGLLDYLVRSAVAHQKSYSIKHGRGKKIPFIEFQTALKALHTIAIRLDWSAKRLLYHGFLTSLSNFAVRADLIVDDTLVEVKTTKDAQHHSEHVAQLLAYYLVSQSPTRKPCEFQVEELAIYYARHGVFVKRAVAPLLRFPRKHLKRVAFNFLVGFEVWRDYGRLTDVSAERMSKFSDTSFNQTLKAVYPRPDWLAARLEMEAARVQNANAANRRSNKILIPDGFLVDD